MSKLWRLTEGNRPLVAVALHDGHDVRPEVAQLLAISPDERKREEDPFTAVWTHIAKTRLVVLRSRFEVDLNRPRYQAIYLTPEDSWGLKVWKSPPPQELIERSLGEYDAFYDQVYRTCKTLEKRYGHFIIYDLHTYNYYRQGIDKEPALALYNPEINLGTGTLDRKYWQPIVERFIDEMRQFDFLGRQLDVRENIKFEGGYFAEWIHTHFPHSACVLAIEVKKFFMNEWTHQLNVTELSAVHEALKNSVSGVLEELQYFK
ncbi:MAG: N-formylglutamate amidohydrolase [Cyanobacteria bacterium P01_A01_bin.83]